MGNKIRFDLPNHPSGYSGESLWADLIKDDLYEIRNIPVFTYGVNYLDVVQVNKMETGIMQACKIVERSGHHTVRVFFVDGKSAEENYRRLVEFKGEGVGSETWNNDIYALSVPPQRDYEAFVDILNQLQEKEIIEYELAGEWSGNFDGTE